MRPHGSEAHPRTMMLHPTFGQSIHSQRKVTFEKAATRRRWVKRGKRTTA